MYSLQPMNELLHMEICLNILCARTTKYQTASSLVFFAISKASKNLQDTTRLENVRQLWQGVIQNQIIRDYQRYLANASLESLQLQVTFNNCGGA